MANANAPYGFKLINPATDNVIVKCICLATDAAVLGFGDPVVFTTNGDVGQPTVTRATAGGGINGIVVNTIDPFSATVGYNPLNTDRRRAASVLNQVEVLLVRPGDGKIFSIQASGTTLLAAQANKFFDMSTVGNANAQTALSTVTLAASTVSATVGDLYYMGLDTVYYPSYNVVTEDYAKVLVQISNT